jgi:hypothetical protein
MYFRDLRYVLLFLKISDKWSKKAANRPVKIEKHYTKNLQQCYDKKIKSGNLL